MLEPVQEFQDTRSTPGREPEAEPDTLLSRLFGVRRADGATVHPGASGGEDGGLDGSSDVALGRTSSQRAEALREEIGERVSSGFRDLSRLLVAIKDTLQNRDGQVQQTLQALPTYLQQVPRIQRAQIDCMAQISRQLEHMGTGTRDVLARLESVPDLLRSLAQSQAAQAQFLDQVQQRTAEALEQQSQAIREGLDSSRRQAETQLVYLIMIFSI